MAGNQIRKALLGKGYFPKELPSAFTTEDFGEHADEILQIWNQRKLFSINTSSIKKTPDKLKRKNAYLYKLQTAEAEIISTPKRGYERRNIHIVHPIPQALLVWEMSENWRAVQKWLGKQVFSEDKIRVSNKNSRALREINFNLHRAKKSFIEAVSDWIVQTDITLFYPSIYTHSIAWAAYGKEHVKKQLGNYHGSLADRFDVLVRSCNRNQTIGIPIGPETSRILAEVISSRIDAEFLKSSHSIVSGVDRLQDDWMIGTNILEYAEKLLSVISNLYRSYGLEINGTKTSINKLISVKKTTWVSEIRTAMSNRAVFRNSTDLFEFLNLCLSLQSQYSLEPVINYALSVVERVRFGLDSIEILESFLLKAAVASPISMNRISQIMLNLQYQTNGVSVRRVSDRFLTLAERALERGHTYETIWLLYTLRGLKRPIFSKRVCELVECTSSSATAILLMDMENKGTWIGNLPKSTWEEQITEDSVLNSGVWLMAYEGFRNGWLSDKAGLMQKSFFKPMKDRKVVFFDPKRNVKFSSKIVELRHKLLQQHNEEVRRMILALRGFDFEEY